MKSEAEPSAAFRWPVRVYFEDTDAGGVVYHATYLHFMERARTEWLRALGFEQDRLREEQGVMFVVRRMGLEYRRAARFNDQLIVTSCLSGQGRASLDFEQTVLREADGSLCCRAGVNVACVDAGRMRPARIPAAILAALSAAPRGSPADPLTDSSAVPPAGFSSGSNPRSVPGCATDPISSESSDGL